MIDEQPPHRASQWLALLLECPDDKDLQSRFQAWLSASPSHAADWAEIRRTYEVMGRTPPHHAAEWAPYAAAGGGPRPLPAIGATPARSRVTAGPFRRPPRRRIAAGLATALLAACLAWLALLPAGQLGTWLPAGWLGPAADIATATAEVRAIKLADGSVLTLAPESAADIAYSADRREVSLRRGAAFVEVAPDARRPFTLRAAGLAATAVGTAYEMRLANDGAAVAVREGAVAAADGALQPPLAARLAAGQWLQVDGQGRVRQGRLPPAQVAAWLRGRLHVKDRPLAETVDRLRPYLDGWVVLADGALADRPVTGSFDLGDPVAALRSMASAQGATVHRLSPWLYVVTGG